MAKGGGGSRSGSGGSGGSKGSGGGKGSLNSLDKFEKSSLKAYDALAKSGGDNLVLIADLRDKIGNKADRASFDKNILDMQRRGVVQTVTGGVSRDYARAEKGAIIDPFGNERFYVRRG